MGGETRRQKSLRIGVHHADAVVWGPVYRTHLNVAAIALNCANPTAFASAAFVAVGGWCEPTTSIPGKDFWICSVTCTYPPR